MFLALLRPSSGARDYDVDYHIGRIVLGLLYVGGYVQLCWSSVRIAGAGTLCLSLQTGHHSSLTAPNLQHTENQKRYDQCSNQHHSREFLMMGTVMSETC